MALRASKGGDGLLIAGDPLFSGGALPYTTEDLFHVVGKQKHAIDITPPRQCRGQCRPAPDGAGRR
jgi:hypothetical protein